MIDKYHFVITIPSLRAYIFKINIFYHEISIDSDHNVRKFRVHNIKILTNENSLSIRLLVKVKCTICIVIDRFPPTDFMVFFKFFF